MRTPANQSVSDSTPANQSVPNSHTLSLQHDWFVENQYISSVVNHKQHSSSVTQQ